MRERERGVYRKDGILPWEVARYLVGNRSRGILSKSLGRCADDGVLPMEG